MTKVKCEYTEMVPLHKLQPNPKNPNKHPENQIEKLAELIDYQGMRSPIVVSKRSGFITKGHGRLLALQHLGWETAPVDYQDYEDEAQEYADIVADNAISEWSNLDFSQINLDIVDFGPELEIANLGFKSFFVDPTDKLVDMVNKGDENDEWVDMPEFNEGGDYIKLIFHFKNEEDREAYVLDNNIELSKKMSNQWIVYK